MRAASDTSFPGDGGTLPATEAPSSLPTKRRNHPPIRVALSDERWQLFLKVLRETGLVRIAAQTASPHLHDPGVNVGGAYAGVSTFMHAIKHDPRRKTEYEAALSDGQARLEQLARERVEKPDERPILNPKDGTVIGIERRWESANRLLLRLLAKLDSSWSDRRELSGTVKHEHSAQPQGDGIFLRSNDIGMLTDEQQTQLFALLDVMENNRRALPGPQTDESETIDGEIVNGD